MDGFTGDVVPSKSQEFHIHPQLDQDSRLIIGLGLCDVRLMDDANHPWLILVPRVPTARELTDLDTAQRHSLSDEIDLTSRTLTRLFSPDKINVAALGNVVPQLHVHVIARFRHDRAWPKPVWGAVASEPYPRAVLDSRVGAIRACLKG